MYEQISFDLLVLVEHFGHKMTHEQLVSLIKETMGVRERSKNHMEVFVLKL